MRTRVKVCGITRPEDAALASELGTDAIGLVFYAKSPRSVTLETASAIIEAAAPFVTRVGLFLNADPDYVQEVIECVPLDLLQFHGNESAADCQAHGKPYIKAVPMSNGFDPEAYTAAYPEAAAYLLDSHVLGRAGGSGVTFDWGLWPKALRKPLILAGGLTSENVGAAIRNTWPYAVDVSSGVEAAKGIKDAAKLAAFIKEVHSVNCTQD